MKKNFFLTLMLALVALFSIDTATAQAPAATPEQAITGLLNRIGGNGAADKFEIVIDASLAEGGKDVFIIAPGNGKPCIKGNNQLSVATGINWYLNHYAHINLTWNNLTTDLSQVTLPVPGSEEKHVSNATYRYDFNTCTFSYSMAFWTWERWQQEIDWMALHGINAPLNLVGLEVVTRNFLEEIGVSESDIDAYIAGPGFMAWFAMNNLEGWGGTINANDVTMNGNPDWWYTRQEQLCRNMLQRMREFGMQPVIPGFSGQVPNCITKYSINGFSSGDVINSGTWANGGARPDIIKPDTESYRTLAAVYYKHLHEVMGVSELYSIDPFHEGGLPQWDKNKDGEITKDKDANGNLVDPYITNEECYPPIMTELDKYFVKVEQSVKDSYKVAKSPSWIIQYWQNIPQGGAFTAMKNAGYTSRFIGLDLFADNRSHAKWNTNYYDTCPYIYCMLHNFGGRSGLHGRLESTMEDYFSALAKGNNCQGIGATPEGTETNPILYDMLFELPWMNSNPGADAWLAEYAHSRYGIKNDNAIAALQNLKKSVWNCTTNQQGTSEAVILARPNWTISSVSSWSTSAIYWDTQDVLLAADQLSSISDLITTADGIANYNYDFIDVVRQAMVDYAAQLLPLINAARNSGDSVEYERLYKLYLQLMLDLDEMLSYDENFKLERWTSLARNIAGEVDGTTVNDRNWLEWNARTQVTVWTYNENGLNDYSNRCWAGLIKDYHYERWKYFFENNGNAPSGGWFWGFERPWTVNFTDYNYSTVTIPDDMTATEKAAQTFGNYFGRIKGATKKYIFPMGIATNATKSDVIPEVYRGKEVELPLIIGKNVTITSIWIDLNNDGNAGKGETLTANDNNVTIPADAVIGKTTAKVTYSDGTVITFNLALIEDITENRTVTAATADANMGTVAIEGTSELTITNMEAVKITATAKSGYNFENWTKDGEVVSNDNPFIYYGKEEATFTANFIQDKWGVVADNSYTSELGTINDYMSFVHNMTFAYYNRDAETIYEAATAPTSVFTTIPQIINVPRGASFDVEYDNGSSNGLKYCYFRAFIDLNADGDFDDDGELLKEVGTNGGENTAVCKNKINVLLPYDAPLGITHMRLRFDGAFSNSNKPASLGAKDGSNRPVYEIILNVTEGSDKAAHIKVESNSAEWGTVECWTDETPGWTAAQEWDVSTDIKMHIKAIPASADVEFLGWYDHYGRLLTTDLEYSRLAIEDATYTARFRKYLEIDGWQIEYRTEPGDELRVKGELANGAALAAGKKYYIAAYTKSGSEYTSRYLYDNGGSLATNTTADFGNYVWTCIVNNDGTYSFQNASGKYLANDGNHYLSIGATAATYRLEAPVAKGSSLVNAADYNGGKYMVTNSAGTAFNRYSAKGNDGSWSSDYVFTELKASEVVVLTKVRQSGNHDLVIPETVNILGEDLKIVGFDNNLFKDNKDLWSISLPATIEQLSSNVLFSTSVKGENTPTDKGDNNPDNKVQVIDLGFTLKNSEAWTIRATYKSDGVSTFNEWGSPLLYPNENGTGKELFYLSSLNGWSSCWHVRAPFTDLGNDYFKDHTNTKISTFIAAIENKGNGKAVITITNSEGQSQTSSEVTFSYDNISAFSAKLPTGLDITNFEVLAGAEPDPFEGCTNLLNITVANGGCQGGYTVDDREFKNASGVVLHTLPDEEKAEKIRAIGELIDLTNALVAEVATNVDPIGKATALALTTTQGSAFYVSTNADQNTGGGSNDGGGIAALVDNNEGTYFHTRWGGTVVNEPHYIQVDLGAGNLMDDFKFTYKPRYGSPAPTAMTVYGSNDGVTFTDVLATINSGLPAHNSGSTYESAAIDSKRYRYLRFTVTGSAGPGNAQYDGQYFFGLLEFDLFKLTSSAEVAPKYANLARVTAGEVEDVYDLMAEALYLYNNGGTAEQLQDAYEALEPFYTALNAKKDKVFNGVYHVKLGDQPLFVAYTATAVPGMDNDAAGYHLFDATTGNTSDANKNLQNTAIANMAAADALFTIVPNDDNSGYTLSAQGLYLHSTRNGGWAPQLLSNDAAQAGVYLFEETETDIYKIRSNRNDIQYMNDWGAVIGNDKSNKPNLSTFTLSQVTEYTLNVPANGVTTLCLPFNVVLPADVTAYDLANANITKANRYSTYELVKVAGEGDVLAKNTPVIIKAATAGDHTLAITMDGEGAKGSVENSLLRSGIVKTTLGEGNNYTFDGENFNRVAAGTEIAANQCWMQLNENLGDIIYGEAPAFILTTDEENPVLYKIISKRGEGNAKVLSYDEPTSEKVKIVDNTANSSYQAWYFVQGENGILIKPYNADGRMLTIESTGDGAGKAMIAADGASNFQEWSFTKSTQNGCTDYYYIKVVGGEGNAGTFSHNGGFGVTDYMGVWASGFNSNDPGSLFKFVDAEFDNDNARFYQLNDYLPAMNQGIFVGESVGLYSEDGVNDLQAKYTEAMSVINKGSNVSSSDDCYAMYKELRAAKKDAYNAPAADKVYYIVSTATGDNHAYCTGKYVHTYSAPHLHENATWGDKTYDQHHLLFDAEGDIEQLSLAAFQFEETGTMGEYKMKNLHTGLYVKSFNKNDEHMGTAADAAVVKIAGIADGQVTLKIGNNNPMHAQNDYSVIVSYNAEANNASTWTINEVPQEDLNEIYTLAVPESGVTTLNLAFNVQLPEGVAAYDFVEGDIAQAEGSDRYEFNLTPVAKDGEVLAKNTPVIIKANAGNYNLKVTFSDNNVKNGTTGSVLRGNCWQTTVGTAEHNYLPGVDGRNFLFNYVVTDNTPVDANTVWMTLAEKSGDIIYDIAEPAPEFTLPEVGKTYRIKSYVSKVVAEYQNHYLVNSTTGLTFSTVAANDNTDLWVCTGADEGNFTFASALGTAALGWKAATEDAVEFTITGGYENGAVTLKNNGKNLALMIDNAGNATFSEADSKTQSAGWSTDWYLEEVENAAVSFTTSIASGNLWATMYLPFAVKIPDGVKAYVATEIAEIDNGNKVINLKPVETNIPKNTAVLLHRSNVNETTTLSLDFILADEDVDAVSSNLFQGKIKRTAIPVAGARVYLLVKYSGAEKFYWMQDEYNANCAYVGAGNGYVKCDANKCYLRIEGANQSAFNFRIEGTTGIDEVEGENGNVKAIYDLQGRKLSEITEPGIYIIDGKKVRVK